MTVYNTLNVTNGNFTVNSGLATVTNGTLATPGDFNKLGAGTLALLGAAQVGSNAVIDAGALLVESTVNAAGDLYVGQTNSGIAMVISNGGLVTVGTNAYLGMSNSASNNLLLVTGTNGAKTASSLPIIGRSRCRFFRQQQQSGHLQRRRVPEGSSLSWLTSLRRAGRRLLQ